MGCSNAGQSSVREVTRTLFSFVSFFCFATRSGRPSFSLSAPLSCSLSLSLARLELGMLCAKRKAKHLAIMQVITGVAVVTFLYWQLDTLAMPF